MSIRIDNHQNIFSYEILPIYIYRCTGSAHDSLADIEPCSGRNSSSSTSSQASHILSRWHTNNNCLKVSASRCCGTDVEVSE